MIEAGRPEEHEGNGHTEKGQRNSNRTRHSYPLQAPQRRRGASPGPVYHEHEAMKEPPRDELKTGAVPETGQGHG